MFQETPTEDEKSEMNGWNERKKKNKRKGRKQKATNKHAKRNIYTTKYTR